MKYESIVKGEFLSRPNRFIAKVFTCILSMITGSVFVVTLKNIITVNNENRLCINIYVSVCFIFMITLYL